MKRPIGKMELLEEKELIIFIVLVAEPPVLGLSMVTKRIFFLEGIVEEIEFKEEIKEGILKEIFLGFKTD
jgi:hypothetical protein